MIQYKSINDVYEHLKIGGFKRGTTEIWYAKPTDDITKDFSLWERLARKGLFRGKFPSNKEELRQTHNKIGSISLTKKEEIFWNMQGENWSPNGEANTLIDSKGVAHTSMSVGDVIYFREKNEAWMVKRGSFLRIWH